MECSEYQRNEASPERRVVKKLIPEPLVVLPRSRDECGLGDQPQDQPGERPCHDGPSKPLQTLSEIVWTRNEDVERTFWQLVLWI